MIGIKEKNFSIGNFEGPLDLLLHLIRSKKMDIIEISLASVADQFVDYVRNTRNLNLDIASEYFLIASQLLDIKSRYILNSDIFNEKSDFQEDTKKLLEKLLEYENFKKISFQLSENLNKISNLEKESDDLIDFIKKDDINLLKIISGGKEDIEKALNNIFKKISLTKPLEQTIKLKRISIEDRRKEIENELNENIVVTFFSILKYNQRYYVALTLLVLLELVIKGKIILKQTIDFEDIEITKK